MRNAIIGQVPRRSSWSPRTGYSASPLLQGILSPDAGLPGISQGSPSPLNSQINGLQGLQDRVRMAGQGMLQEGRAAFGVDEANRQQSLSAARSRLAEPMAGIPNRMSPLTGAVSGGAVGAGMVQRYRPGSPLAQLAMSPGIQMTPDRGLGSVIASRYGEEPLVFNRQMTDQQAMDRSVQGMLARSPERGMMTSAGTGFTRTNKFGEQAYTSRRQYSEDQAERAFAEGRFDEGVRWRNDVESLKNMEAEREGNMLDARALWRSRHGDMSERDWNKEQRVIRAGRKWMKENKINPKSPLAQTLYPEVMADAQRRAQAAEEKTKTSSPLSAAPGSARAEEQAKTFINESAQRNMLMQKLGANPEWSSFDLIKSLHNSENALEVGDVKELQGALQSYRELDKKRGLASQYSDDPYRLRGPITGFNQDETKVLTELFTELESLPDSDKSRQEWAGKFQNRKSLMQSAKSESDMQMQRIRSQIRQHLQATQPSSPLMPIFSGPKMDFYPGP